jgi:AcrR family transcriptional regulator
MTKKEEIIEATYELFANKGYNLSMSEIANKVGLKVPSLYSHFQSKDEIIDQMIEKEISYYFEMLEEEIKILNKNEIRMEEKLRKLYLFICDYYKNSLKIRLWKNIFLNCSDTVNAKTGSIIIKNDQKMQLLLKDIYEEGGNQEQITPNTQDGSIFLFLIMIQGVLDYMLLYEDLEGESIKMASVVWQAYWDGIKYR